MATSRTNSQWDAVAEKNRFLTALDVARKVQHEFGDVSKSKPGFSLLCLAELDAGNHLSESDCFSNREAFLAEVRRLIAEPTKPSQPVSSLQAYTDSQKWWLESLIKQYEYVT